MIAHRGKLGGRKGRKRGREKRGRKERERERKGKVEERKMGRGVRWWRKGEGKKKEKKEEGKEEKRERVNSSTHYLVVTLPHTLSNSSVIRGRMMLIPVITISTNWSSAEHIIK